MKHEAANMDGRGGAENTPTSADYTPTPTGHNQLAKGDDFRDTPLPVHYRPVEVLGRARGRVTYLAVDKKSGQQVIVKAVLQATDRKISAALRQRLSRQVRTLTLLDHPNIAPLHGLETAPNGIFIVRDLAPGVPLSEWVKEPLPFALVATMLRDLASGMAAAHALGVTHGDITAENVILRTTPEGPELRIVDFGLAPLRHDDRRHQSFTEQAGSWPRYLGADDDPRADLHALGVLAYELLTGHVPGEVQSHADALPTAENVQHKQRPVRSWRPETPPALAAIIEKLLSPALTECYQSAASLLADLEQYIERTQDSLDFTFQLGQLDGDRVLGLVPPFVGRTRELDRLVEHLDEAQTGQGCVVMLRGESGLGKSRLVREIIDIAEERGGVVLGGYCTETGLNPAFFPWREALAGYPQLWAAGSSEERAMKAERLSKVVAGLSADMHQLAPAFAQLIPKRDATEALDGSRQWQRHVDLVARVVLELASLEGFLVVVLEDLQWADNETIEVIRYLTSRASRVPVLVLGTYRSDEVDAEHPLSRLHQHSTVGRSRIASVDIEGLHIDDIREMLVALVGEPGEAVDHASAAVLRRSGGNALLAIHSVHSLLEERVLRLRDGRWTVDKDRLASQSVPGTVLDVLLRRIGRISAKHRAVLAPAAIVGRLVSVELMAAIHADRQEVIQAFVMGVRGALLEKVDDDTYRFVHDKVREAFLSALSQSELRATHGLLADHLEARLDAGEPVLLQLAVHRLESGDTERAYEIARRAGLWAWENHENDAGIRLLSAAMERQPHDIDKDDLLPLIEAHGECYARVGRFDEALEAYRRVLAILTSEVDQARIERKVGGVYFGMGDSARAVRHLERALHFLGTRLPQTRFGLTLFIARELIRQTFHSLLPIRWARRKSAASSAKLREVVRIFDEMARIYFFLDLPKTVAIHLRQLNVSEWIGPSREMAMTYSAHGVVCATAAMLDRALSYQQQGLALREDIEDSWGIGQSHCFSGVVRYTRGELAQAVDECLKGRKILQGLGDQWEIETVTYHLHLCYLRAGQLTDSTEEAERLLELSREIRDAKFEALALGGLARLAALRGDFRRGLQIADEAVKTSPDALSVILALGQKGQIYLQRGEHTSAREVLEEAWELALRGRQVQDYTTIVATSLAEAMILEAHEKLAPGETLSGPTLRRCKKACKRALKLGTKFPGHRATALRVQALLETARGRVRKALARLRESVAAAEALGARLELAQTEEALGRTLAEVGHPEAREHLDRARNLYEEMDAWGYRTRLAEPTSAPATRGGTSGIFPAVGGIDEAARASFLVKVARTLAATLDLDTLLTNLAELALERFGADRVALYLPDDAQGALGMRLARGVSMASDEESKAVHAAWESCRSVNVAPKPGEGELPRPAVIAVPIPHREDLVGVLFVHRAEGAGFHSSEQSLMEILASQAGMSIANATAYLTIARLNRHLQRKVEEVAQRTDEVEASRAALHEQARNLEEEVLRRTESLQHSVAELEKANRLKREFLATVSHELRTPMNAIICFTELVLEDEGLDMEQRDSLERVLSNARHLMGLLEELLDLSRIERGHLVLEFVEVELDDLLDAVSETVRPSFQGSVAFIEDWPEGLGYIPIDPRRMQQILINLITNAIKFTVEGSVTLRVRREPDHVMFEVIDTGIGIHPDHHEAVFEKFRQVDGTIARSKSGLGLGLSLCRELARLLDSDITLESAPEKGATFRMRVPTSRTQTTHEIDPRTSMH